MDDHTGPLLDLLQAAPEIITNILACMPLRDRFNSALVCKAWAEAARAATHSFVLKHQVQDVSGLQTWLEQHGQRLEVLQLHAGYNASLTALPCCAKLQDLLHGFRYEPVSVASRTWGDIASATKLTSIGLKFVQTASQQADVVSALTALPNLEQLTWHYDIFSIARPLSDSLLFQKMTQLTSLDLKCVAAATLQHLSSLSKLQHLSINVLYADAWAAAGCPGLQELKALTSLELTSNYIDLPASASHLTALRQLEIQTATPTALNRLQVLTGLTQLRVWEMAGLSCESPPLQLPGLQHLELDDTDATMPMSFPARCTQLQLLKLQGAQLQGGGSLVASTMLQYLKLTSCRVAAAGGAAEPVSWQQVLLGPGRLPHLTSLRLLSVEPPLQQVDIEGMVTCCSNLKVLGCDMIPSSCVPALRQLPDLTHLQLLYANDEECCAMVQLTGLRQLMVNVPWDLSAVGLRQLTALQQLTSLGLGYFGRNQLDTVAKHLMLDNLADCSYAIIHQESVDPVSPNSNAVRVVCSSDGDESVWGVTFMQVCGHAHMGVGVAMVGGR